MKKYKNLDQLDEYIEKRNRAFESKIFDDISNPLPDLHFCNNQKYLDAFSQDIIFGNKQLLEEGAHKEELLYNTLVHRVLLNKEFCRDNTDKYGIFRMAEYETLCENILNHRSFHGRYRNMMQNVHLTKLHKDEFFQRIIETTLPLLEQFDNCNQSDIWNSNLSEGFQIGPFTRYQLSSDLLYIDSLNITPDYIDYSKQGTANGFHHITEKHDWDQYIIDYILDKNAQYDHKTELTELMIPSDANNVLCEFYKYTVSKQKRYRTKEVSTRPKLMYLVPDNIRRYNNENLSN